jgi:uncharacterized membrane protein
MNLTMIVLRLIHVVGAVFWAGALFMNVGFLLPAVRATGPAGGAFMRQLMGVQKLSQRVAAAAILSVLSGLALYMMDIKLSGGAFARSRQGMVFGIGGLAGILALIPGIGIVARTGTKLLELGETIAKQGGPPSAEQSAEMARLQQRMAKGGHAAAGLVGIALVAMAIARYV